MVKPHQIAIHEAAHATIAVVQGLGFKGAKLGENPIVPLDPRLNRCAGSAENEINARFYLGGFCGERRFYPTAANPENSRKDFANALAYLPKQIIAVGQALEYLPNDETWHRRLCEAELLVARYVLAIRNVASELLERQSLNPLQISSLVRKSSR